MGNYAIKIEGVGGHGCDRAAKEGEALAPRCELTSCPDCGARDLVERLKQYDGVNVAEFTHWPGEPSEVVDDILNNTRKKGNF